MREVLNTLFYLHRSGCRWDRLPHDVLPKSTVYDSLAQWRADGTWRTLTISVDRYSVNYSATSRPDSTIIAPVSAYHRVSYAERYSRSIGD